MSKPSVGVRIAGHDYRIRSDADPDALREIAGYVDRAMARVRAQTGTVDSFDVAVLTCLNLAREILALHDRRLDDAVDAERLRGLIERVESALGWEAASLEVEQPEAARESAEPRPESPRTLELPSLDSLRERSAERGDAVEDPGLDVVAPPARVAAAGRDRAS
ncbi:MAG: cell division protein ZapA [Spirochaetaceae bacterium]|nr:cell division protein ZapA [Myxococcales bacterium]MCB9723531.1 cell division protein ZapA [Spirochaetaceae bacterium]